jgi:hypothetical protein
LEEPINFFIDNYESIKGTTFNFALVRCFIYLQEYQNFGENKELRLKIKNFFISTLEELKEICLEENLEILENNISKNMDDLLICIENHLLL